MSSLTPVVRLVDDDAGDQELTRRALTAGSLEGELRTADNGGEALDYSDLREHIEA